MGVEDVWPAEEEPVVLPDLASIVVEVDPVLVGAGEVDEYIEGLRHRYATFTPVDRPAGPGDYVQLDLAASVDDVPVERGQAGGVTHEVGTGHLLAGLDEAVVGLTAGRSRTIRTQLVGGALIGRDADLTVRVTAVLERRLPDLDEAFILRVSGCATLDELRRGVGARLTSTGRRRQLYAARDKVLDEIVAVTTWLAPDDVVRAEVELRRRSLTDQLHRLGMPSTEYFTAAGSTLEEADRELTTAVAEQNRIQYVLDALADAAGVEITREELSQGIIHRARRAGADPQDYLDRLVERGAEAAVTGDLRRAKALADLMRTVTIKDTAGTVLVVDPDG